MLSSGHKVVVCTHEATAVVIICTRSAHEPSNQISNTDEGGPHRPPNIAKEIFAVYRCVWWGKRTNFVGSKVITAYSSYHQAFLLRAKEQPCLGSEETVKTRS